MEVVEGWVGAAGDGGVILLGWGWGCFVGAGPTSVGERRKGLVLVSCMELRFVWHKV